jgi:hypothetical protein
MPLANFVLDKGLKAAFDDNYSDYKDTIPQLFRKQPANTG